MTLLQTQLDSSNQAVESLKTEMEEKDTANNLKIA